MEWLIEMFQEHFYNNLVRQICGRIRNKAYSNGGNGLGKNAPGVLEHPAFRKIKGSPRGKKQ